MSNDVPEDIGHEKGQDDDESHQIGHCLGFADTDQDRVNGPEIQNGDLDPNERNFPGLRELAVFPVSLVVLAKEDTAGVGEETKTQSEDEIRQVPALEGH